MTEASRLEQSLSAAGRERFDAAAVVRGCAEGYRLAYAPRAFEVAVPEEPAFVAGAADLLAQMLDKLVENAVDFAVAGTAIRIVLASGDSSVLLRVENEGAPLPDAIRDSLFDSMVSLRSERADGVPHLGLGLYIARLIAEFHGGRLRAENLPAGRGVAFEATLARAL
jgi:signal transduction histidine kinase